MMLNANSKVINYEEICSKKNILFEEPTLIFKPYIHAIKVKIYICFYIAGQKDYLYYLQYLYF